MTKTRKRGESGRKRRPREGPPPLHGWISTDEDEIKRRRWRGRTEIDQVHALGEHLGPFGDYRVTSSSGSSYVVEIRSLRERVNSLFATTQAVDAAVVALTTSRARSIALPVTVRSVRAPEMQATASRSFSMSAPAAPCA